MRNLSKTTSPTPDSIRTKLNSVMMATGGVEQRKELKEINIGGQIFFDPDMDMLDWIIEYAKERMIIEVGSGCGHLLRMLQAKGVKKLMGIEPLFDPMIVVQINSVMGRPIDGNKIHVIPMEVSKCGGLIKGITEHPIGALVIVARPSHTNLIKKVFRRRNT